MRGCPTSSQIKEELIVAAIETCSVPMAARKVGLPRTTAYDLIRNNDEFVRFRTIRLREYVVRAWQPVESLLDALKRKTANSARMADETSVRELSYALAVLTRSIATAQFILMKQRSDNAQQQIPQLSQEEIDDAVFAYLEQQYQLSKAEIHTRLAR